jgi:hypothetical protein
MTTEWADSAILKVIFYGRAKFRPFANNLFSTYI